MGVNTSVRYSDLSYEKQQDLIEWIKTLLFEDWKVEGEEILKKPEKWHVAPKTWQEAYCRSYSIDYRMWGDLDENSEDFKNYDWDYALTEHAEEEALNKIVTGFKYCEVEIDLD